MWFAVGMLAAVVAAVGLSVVVAPARIGILSLAIPLFGFVGGGAIAGRSLRLGRRGVVAFAVAFAVALPILMVPWINIQGMNGSEGFSRLVVDFGSMGAVAFALMGGVGVAIAGLGGREVVRSAAVFGCAGFLGGLLLAVCLSASAPGASRTNLILMTLGSIGFVLLPATLGGTVLTRRLASHNRVRNTTA